jgi:hypothetical protein
MEIFSDVRSPLESDCGDSYACYRTIVVGPYRSSRFIGVEPTINGMNEAYVHARLVP